MLKRFGLVAVLTCSILLSLTLSVMAGITYQSRIYHYSITVPDRWVQISEQYIRQFQQSTAQNSSRGSNITFETGFQKPDRPLFRYPYIVIMQHPAGTRSYSSLCKAFSSEAVQGQMKSELSKILGNVDISDIRIDRSRGMISFVLNSDVAGVGKVTSLVTLYVGRNGMTQVCCCSLASSYAKDRMLYDSVLNTFKYEPDYAYDESIEPAARSKGILKDLKTLAEVGLITALIIRGLRKRSASRRTKDPDDKTNKAA